MLRKDKNKKQQTGNEKRELDPIRKGEGKKNTINLTEPKEEISVLFIDLLTH